MSQFDNHQRKLASLPGMELLDIRQGGIFSIEMRDDFREEDLTNLLIALSDMNRASGGLGFQFETRAVEHKPG